MIDGTIFGAGFSSEVILGALIVGFWIASRVRASRAGTIAGYR